MRISISREGFTSKPAFPPSFNYRNYDINTDVSPKQLCRLLSNGHILAPPVKDNVERNGKVERNVANVEGRQYVMVDIESDDHEKIPEITPDLLNSYTGELAPTFVYASYSDGVKGHRYHFVWCFDELITTPEQNLDIWSRCRTIAKEIVGERYEDDESVKDLARICYGSYDKPYFSTNNYKIFHLTDFSRIEPFLPSKQNGKERKKNATRANSGDRGAVRGGIFDKGDHFGFERRQDVIFTLFHFWKDAAKVREIYERIDPNRTNSEEGESLIRSAIDYDRRNVLHPTSEGIRICKELDVLPRRNDFTKHISFDTEIVVPGHIADKKKEVIASLGRCSLLVSPPGSGKTVFSQCLSGNVLVVQMMKSIVDSSKYPNGWVKVCDKRYFPKFWKKQEPQRTETDRNLFSEVEKQNTDPTNQLTNPTGFGCPNTHIVCTIDKLKLLDVEKLKHFDYIVVDESHIIFESSNYRQLGFVIPLFSKLCNSDWRGKILLMTGTPILERKYFPDLHTIRVTTEREQGRECIITKVKKPEVAVKDFIVNALRSGKKVLFPSNRTDARGRILSKIRRENPDLTLNAQVFSRPLHYEQENISIRVRSEVPKDTNVLCCTTYLGVGLDIFDKGEWVVVMLGEWVAPQIVQFANRLREKDLYIHCFCPDVSEKNLDCVWLESRRIMRLTDGANGVKTEGVWDPVRDQGLLKNYPCIVWSEEKQCYVVDELLRDIYLDWVDYQQFHSKREQLQRDLEEYGFAVEFIDETTKPKEPRAKRHAAVTEDDNELLAQSIAEIMRKEPDFDSREDLQFVNPHIKAHYITNIRPMLRRLLKIYEAPDGDKSATYQTVRALILSFLFNPYDVKLGREKLIIYETALRNFVESHKLATNIASYSTLFQEFYSAVQDFVRSKAEFEKQDINDFIAGQVAKYTDDDKLKKSFTSVVRGYYKIFVSETSHRKTEKYKERRVYTLSLNQNRFPEVRNLGAF